jgi:hypothetical protein
MRLLKEAPGSCFVRPIACKEMKPRGKVIENRALQSLVKLDAYCMQGL